MKDAAYKLYNDIKVSPRPDNRYKVLEEFSYKDVTVPVNYHTNGANIPRILWSIWPPNRSDYLPAVIVHDYLCDIEDYKKADEYFKEMLELMCIDKATIWFFYNGVVLYHKIRYKV